MQSSVSRRVPGPVSQVRHRLELLPSVHQVLALASFQPEDFDLAADLGAIARRAAVRARALSWADGAVVEITDDDGLVDRAKTGSGAAGRPRRQGDAPDHPWRVLVCDKAQGQLLQLLAEQVTTAVIRARMITELRGIDRHHKGAFVANEASFRRVFFEHPQPMWVLDATTQRFLAVNDAAVAKYGYSAEEFAALTIAVIPRDAAHLAVDFNRARTGKTAYNARHRLRDGRLIDVEVSTVAQEFDDRPGI